MRDREAFASRREKLPEPGRGGSYVEQLSWEEQLPSVKKHSLPKVALHRGSRGNKHSDLILLPPSHSYQGSPLAKANWNQRARKPGWWSLLGQSNVKKGGRWTWMGQVSKICPKHDDTIGLPSAKSRMQRTRQDKQPSSFFFHQITCTEGRKGTKWENL